MIFNASHLARALRHSRRLAVTVLLLLPAVLVSSTTSVGTARGETGRSLTLLALGDSLVAGYGLSDAESFTVRLEAALRDAGRNVTVYNGGVSGDTTAGGLARMGWLLANPPDAVLLELGANDGLRGLDPRDTEANLDAILAEFGRRDIPVLLAGMLAPPNLGADYGRDFNAIYPRLAERYGVALYPFFLDGVAANPDLNQDDGIHPNAAGVAVIVERILPFILDVLDQVETTTRPR